MANQRTERVPTPHRRTGSSPASIQGLPMLSARGLARAASQSDGTAELYKQTADIFGRVAADVGKIADAAAQREGNDAGALAGLDREFRPKGDLTIYGQAFDQAGIETFKSKLAVDVSAQMQAAADKHQADPTGLAQALAGVKAGWQETVDDARLAAHVKPEFEALFLRNQTGLMRAAQREHMARVKADQLAALESERETRTRTAEQQAFRLGLDVTADEILAGEIVDLKKRLEVRGPDGNFIVAPNIQAKVLRDTEVSMGRARIMGAFSRLDTLDEKAAFIKQLEDGYQAGGDRVLDLFAPAEYQAIVATLTSQARQQELGAEQSKRETRRFVKSFVEAAKSGITLPDAEMTGLKARVAATNDPEIIQDFDDAVDTLAIVRHLNMTPPAQIEAMVDQERARLTNDGTSLESREVARLKVAEDYLKNAHTELSRDPLGFAAKAGTANIAPLSITDPLSMGKRAAEAEHVAQFYGRPVTYFRPEEKEALAAASKRGGDEMLGVATSIVHGMQENAPEALAEISKEAPALAMAGGLWRAIGGREPPEAVRDIAKGIALRGHKDYSELATTDDMLRETGKIIGSSYSDLDADRVALITTAKAIYEGKAYANGTRAFDKGLWRQSVLSALGERVIDGKIFGGVVSQRYWFSGDGPEIVLPPTVRQDAFHDVLAMIDLGDLDRAGMARPVGEDGNPISMARIRNGLLVQAGNGRYKVSLGQPGVSGQEDYVPDWSLDLNALVPILAQRRPDLFSGGGP